MTRQRTDYLALALICVVFVLCSLVFDKFRATAISVSLLAVYANIAVRWANRREVWLWTVVFAFVVLNAVAITFLDLNLPRGPALTYVVPAAFVEAFVMFGILNVVERRMSGPE